MFRIEKIKLIVVLVGIFLISSLFSCSDNSDEIPENIEAVKVENNDLRESDEDLLKVDYKQFYDALAPYGEWIEITEEDIDVDLNKGTASGEKVHRKMTLSQVFGVKEAYADANFGAFFVWRPSPSLAVGVTTGNAIVAPEPVIVAPAPVPAVAVVQPTYVPYTNGQWMYTDAGWYFMAATPHEEIVHHHGRWTYSPALGWIWVPGRVWSPAWVTWRTSPSYIAWAPMAPGIYLEDNVIVEPVFYEDRYVIVENRYFLEPQIYKYKHKKNKLIIHQLTPVPGITVVNHTIVNRGPDISVVQSVLGRDVEVVNVHRVKEIGDFKYTGNVINSYSPDFREFRPENVLYSPVRKPGKYLSKNEYKQKYNVVDKTLGNDRSINENERKVIERTLGKDNNRQTDNEVLKKNNKSSRDDKQIKRDNKRSGNKDRQIKKDNRNQRNDKDIKRNNKRSRNDQQIKKDNKRSGNKDRQIKKDNQKPRKEDKNVRKNNNRSGSNDQKIRKDNNRSGNNHQNIKKDNRKIRDTGQNKQKENNNSKREKGNTKGRK